MTQKEIKSPYKSESFSNHYDGAKARLKIDTFMEDVYDIDSLINELNDLKNNGAKYVQVWGIADYDRHVQEVIVDVIELKYETPNR